MLKAIIVFQFSPLIPIVVYLILKPLLDPFFKVLFASLLLSIFFDFLGNIFIHVYQNNLGVLYCYYLSNAVLITYLWTRTPFYSDKDKKLVRNIGIVLTTLMLAIFLYIQDPADSLYTASSVSVFLGLIFALHYYYKKISLSTHTPPLKDPYFITATGFILFCLSTIIINVSQIFYEGETSARYTWVLRQAFYMIYNIIIAYAFYVLHKTQKLR